MPRSWLEYRKMNYLQRQREVQRVLLQEAEARLKLERSVDPVQPYELRFELESPIKSEHDVSTKQSQSHCNRATYSHIETTGRSTSCRARSSCTTSDLGRNRWKSSERVLQSKEYP